MIRLEKKHIEREIKSRCKNVQREMMMKKWTSLKIGGVADFFVQPEDINELKNTLRFARENNIPYFILGNGTNILVADRGIRGLVIKLNKFNKMEIVDNKIKAQGGVALSRVLNAAIGKNLSGLEFAHGIPASVGGAIKTNAGTDESGVGEVLEELTILGENLEEKVKKHFLPRYREGLIDEGEVVLQAKFKLKEGREKEIKDKIKFLKEKRKRTQPQKVYSCGCVFKNPGNLSAGYLLDKCGAKGLTSGGAEVSQKHANFIINRKNATARDFLNLIEKLKKMVKEKFKINLQLEIKLVGDF